MEMFDPPHPGEILSEDCLRPLGLTVTAAAKPLGVTREAFSDLLNDRSGILPERAVRLELAGWTNAPLGLRIQTEYEPRRARRRAGGLKVRRPQPPAAA